MNIMDYWTVHQVVEHTGYHPEHVRRRSREGTIPSAFRFGGRWAFKPEIIRRWWAAGGPKTDPRLFD